MKIVALLNFFDEDPQWLRDALDSAAKAGATHLLAVDGPYANFPHTFIKSPEACYDAIHGTGLPTVVCRSASAWAGDEVAKRKFMLWRALRETESDDWLMVLDSDYRWKSDTDLPAELAATEHDVAEVSFSDVSNADGSPHWQPANLLMRARADLQLARNHYTYYLGGEQAFDVLCRQKLVSSLDLRKDVFVKHLVHHRTPERRARQEVWYKTRDSQGLET